ncbi:MAG: hypothetical protein GF313_04790 [Caldithrix sp.]|nr:hypothetical protein [Caldithrix sp.]
MTERSLNWKTTLTLLFFLMILSRDVIPANNYPEWFIYPQEYPELIIGYSYGGLSAKEDAAYMYCIYKDCIAEGRLEIFDVSGSNDLLKNSNYYYYFSDDSVSSIEKQLKLVEKFDINILTGDYIGAFTLDTITTQKAPRIQVKAIKKPEWIAKTFYQDDQYYYGVGMYTAQGRENDGWKTAEEQAVFSILNNLAVEVHKINLLAEENTDILSLESMEEITFIRIYYNMQNINIIQRYPDLKNKLYYALARISKSDLYSPMLK